jgi:putative FmdB family regulatory protein
MPIYEYQCKACEHKLEKLQKISDEPLKDCPACSEPQLNKLVSAAAFRLKGGGWYETDFKTGKKQNVSGSDSAPSDSGSSSSGSSSKDSSSASTNS